jgi:hypothetical protein
LIMPAGIKYWSTTAASNNSAVPFGAPEGWFPSDVNNWGRQVMADVRSQCEDMEWFDWGHTPTFVSSSSFSVTGDRTAIYTTGRRIKITDSSTLYGTIASSSFSSVTTVSVTLDSGSITGSITAVAPSIIKASSGTGASIVVATGNVVGQASSVDNEIALFSGTGGKTIKRATGTGFAKITSGVLGTPTTLNDTLIETSNVLSTKLTTEGTIASASTTNLGSITTTNIISITGTTTITSFGSSATTTNPLYFVRFTGALTLTHNGTSLILPSSSNITTAAGDSAMFLYLGSGNWRCLDYQRINGQAIVQGTDLTGRDILAWVNFNGTGTVSIRDSFNVSSITDNGAGDYTINFTTALANANYAICGIGYQETGVFSAYPALRSVAAPTTSSARVMWKQEAGGAGIDTPYCYLMFIGD